MAQNGQPPTPTAPTAPTTPAQPAAKSTTVAPKLASEVEMSNLPAGEEQTDIMQLARVGDIPAMQKIFDAGEFDATYSDGEGITPLHVRSVSFPPSQFHKALEPY
jgi:palmitoyltransferase ZDHHC13/17